MKKTLILMAAASAFVLTGCTETDLSGDTSLAKESAPSAIEFSAKTRTSGGTRAGATGTITDTSIKDGTSAHWTAGFGAFAYLSNASFADETAVSVAPNFMYNQQVKYSTSNTKWEYSPLKYWPNGIDQANNPNSPSNSASESAIQYLNFFAYAPYVPSASGETGITAMPSNSTTDLKFTITQPAIPTESNCVDFLWGLRNDNSYAEADGTPNTTANKYNVGLTKQTVDEKVNFLFKHALAKVAGLNALKVVADFDGNGVASTGFGTKDANTLITVTSITIKDVLDDGGKSTLKKSGKFDISTGTWSDITQSTATEQQTLASVTISNMNEDIAENFTSGFPTATAENNVVSAWQRASETNIEGVTTSEKNVYKASATNSDGILLIPSEAGQKLEIAVTYVVRTFDNKLNASASGSEGTWTKVTQTITNQVTLPALEVHKKYTLVLHLGLTSVKFEAQVADWDAVTAGTNETDIVWLPSNVVATTTSADIAVSGAHATTVTATASATTYTINLTGVKNSSDVTVAVSGEGFSAASPVTASNTGNATITVTLPTNNTNATKSATVTLTGRDSSEVAFTETVTINQLGLQ